MKSFYGNVSHFSYLILICSFAMMVIIRMEYNTNIYFFPLVLLAISIGFDIFISYKKVPLKIVIKTPENLIQIKYLSFYRIKTIQLNINETELKYDYKLTGEFAKEKILILLTSKEKYHLTPQHYLWNDNTINEIFNILSEIKAT